VSNGDHLNDDGVLNQNDIASLSQVICQGTSCSTCEKLKSLFVSLTLNCSLVAVFGKKLLCVS
jgi:hypothetical protein